MEAYGALYKCCNAIEDGKIDAFMFIYEMYSQFGIVYGNFIYEDWGPLEPFGPKNKSRAYRKAERKPFAKGFEWTRMNKCYG